VDGAAAAPAGSLWRYFAGTFVLTLSNPATIVSFIAVFGALAGGSAQAAAASAPAVMVAGVLVGSALWWLFLSSAVGRLRERFDDAWRRRINQLSAAVLAAHQGFGLGQEGAVRAPCALSFYPGQTRAPAAPLPCPLAPETTPMQEARKTDAPTRSTPHNLPAQPISEEVLIEKYAKGEERTARAVHERVARALAQAEKPEQRALWRERFAQALDGGFVPAGRIQSAAGTELSATLINCFVQPVGDSIAIADDGYPGIYTALTEAAETMRRGGGVGYDFSRIRPRGAWVGSTQSNASGPDGSTVI